ncbi:hypothetical protein HK098_005779 [Nowakowskiella sp. JEL0407]|nr:hypothetical protein HK098_005779 [Nowakowskiella sp. JEL0407]
MPNSEKHETLTHVDPIDPAPPLPPYTATASTYKAIEVIACDKAKKTIAFGPNTANPVIPETISATVKWSELILDLSQLPVGTIMNIDFNIKFSNVVVVVAAGVLAKNDVSVSMADSKDKRTNFTLRDGHTCIFLTGSIKFGEISIVDNIELAVSKKR